MPANAAIRSTHSTLLTLDAVCSSYLHGDRIQRVAGAVGRPEITVITRRSDARLTTADEAQLPFVSAPHSIATMLQLQIHCGRT